MAWSFSCLEAQTPSHAVVDYFGCCFSASKECCALAGGVSLASGLVWEVIALLGFAVSVMVAICLVVVAFHLWKV